MESAKRLLSHPISGHLVEAVLKIDCLLSRLEPMHKISWAEDALPDNRDEARAHFNQMRRNLVQCDQVFRELRPVNNELM
jgi:hypothetical protein